MVHPLTKRELLTGQTIDALVSADELRTHLFTVYDDTTDPFLDTLIAAATDYLETAMWRKFVQQKWRLYLSKWPADDEIHLPFGSVLSVEKVSWLDGDATDHVLTTDEYIPAIVGEEPMILPVDNWPSGTLFDVDSIRIEFTAGYGAKENVPKMIKHAVLMLAAHWYETRETVIVGTTVRNVPFAVKAIIGMNKARRPL